MPGVDVPMMRTAFLVIKRQAGPRMLNGVGVPSEKYSRTPLCVMREKHNFGVAQFACDPEQFVRNLVGPIEAASRLMEKV